MNFISTGLLNFKKTSTIIKKIYKHNIQNIELSSGKYEKNLEKFLYKFKKENNINFLIHNYFPAPKSNFVFNLASNNNKIRGKSIKLAERAIKLSKKLNSKFYSFHAGFLIDPKVNSLGKTIKKQEIINRKSAINNFLKSVKYLSKIAKINKIKLLIENNVLTKKVFEEFNQNPFLFVESNEIVKIIKKMPNNVKLLIDVGHLNVSSLTLRFDKLKFIQNCLPHIEAYHLSENNHIKDQNKPINNNSWFFKFVKKDIVKVLELKTKNFGLIKKQIKLLDDRK
jgi:sugar phosphate isomerase/epimerase